MEDKKNTDDPPEDQLPEEINAEGEPDFEMTPDEATGFGEEAETPGLFNRKRVVLLLAVAFALVVGGGLLYNTARSGKKAAQEEADLAAASTPSDLLDSLRNRALNNRAAPPEAETPEQITEPEPRLPPASVSRSPEVENVRNPPPQNYPPPSGGGGGPAPAQDMSLYRSPLVPAVEGRMFAGSFQPSQNAPAGAPGSSAADDYYRNALAAQNARGGASSEYMLQNNQENKQEFYNSAGSGGMIFGGRFLGENALWPGTVIPGILETAINTDLPGNVLARTTRNIYDSQTGRKLLVPQGTLLIARYNSSVSYAQHRVQIVWDTLIRPDGYQLDLEGMNSVDKAGMSGQAAAYHENWFEYLKAAGLLTMFSLANARMTETVAKYANDAAASAVASSNQELVNQLGGSIVGRAMNIQPTLTVDNGTVINIMLNKSLYLPPVNGYPAVRKYILE